MSERVEAIRAAFDKFAEHGVDGGVHLFDPDVTWVAPPDWLDTPTYTGHAGLHQIDATWRENFDDFGLDVEDVREVGERVVVLLVQHGLIKGGSERLEQRIAWVLDFGENGLITMVRGYFSWDEALAEATRS